MGFAALDPSDKPCGGEAMKINGVESFFVEVPQKPPIAPYHSRYRGQSVKRAILIRLETDQGLVGWGETPQVYLGTQLTGREAAALRPVLMGKDPTVVMAVYADWKFDHIYIQSAVEMALWDLAGKTYGLPLYRLLGGPCRKEIELAACILVLIVAHRRFGPPSRTALAWLSALWLLLVISRYAEVTSPALYGRDVNLYWDLRYVPAVAAMLARAAPSWLLLAAGTGLVLTLIALYLMLRWSLGRIGEAISDFRERRILGLVAAAAAMLFAGQRLSARFPGKTFCPIPPRPQLAAAPPTLWKTLAASK